MQHLTQLLIPHALPQIACDSDNGRIFIAKENTIYLYNFDQKKAYKIFTRKEEILNTMSNQLVFVAKLNHLISRQLSVTMLK